MNDKSMMVIQSHTQPLNHFRTHSLRVYGTSGVISPIRPAARGIMGTGLSWCPRAGVQGHQNRDPPGYRLYKG